MLSFLSINGVCLGVKLMIRKRSSKRPLPFESRYTSLCGFFSVSSKLATDVIEGILTGIWYSNATES